MKKVFMFVLINLSFINLHSQNFEWAKREGLWAYDYGYGITNDNSGNVYVTGKYEMNAKFSGIELPCQGNHDIFLAQYSSSGELKWIKTAGGEYGDYAHAIASDGINYIYVAGEIEGNGTTVKFINSPITLNTKGVNDIFLAKYDLNGNLIWAKSAGGLYNDKALGITYDKDGNVYISGFFNSSATFGENTTIKSSGLNEIFIAKYDRNGNFLWVQKAGGPEKDAARSIKCDASGNVYICGDFRGTATFGNQTIYTPKGYCDGFLAKYDPNGSLTWIKSFGGDKDDLAWSLTIDNAGKVYVTGEFSSNALFDKISLTTAGKADIFITCYDASGNVQWAKRAGGELNDKAMGITCNGATLYLTGQFGVAATFGSAKLYAKDSSDVFIAALNNSGDFIWSTSVGGKSDSFEPVGFESGIAICAEGSGNVYVTGAILDGGTFGNTALKNYSRTDVFITKILDEAASPTKQVPTKLIAEPGRLVKTVE